MHVWIGTSGYSYTDWVGSFYEPGTRPQRMLAQYAQHFPLVELNLSFYRMPTPSMLARLADQTPAGFQFIVKMPRSLSHEKEPRELAPFRAAVEELRRRQRLLGVLCQLPQATHREPRHEAWLELLAREFAGCRLAVEFRHQSWSHADVPAWLAEQQVDLVSVDVPELPALYPCGLVQSGSRIYVRFHSRRASSWYGSDKERYDFDYGDESLKEWIRALSIAQADVALLLFNNCQRAQAALNAQRMRELLSQMGSGLTVVAPAPVERERTLFD